jgi:hypothetical protein
MKNAAGPWVDVSEREPAPGTRVLGHGAVADTILTKTRQITLTKVAEVAA